MSEECCAPVRNTAGPRARITTSDREELVCVYIDCAILTIFLSYCVAPRSSASPPALPLPDVFSPAASPGSPCDVEPHVVHPPAAPMWKDPAARPPASDPFAPSQPVDLSALYWLLPPSAPPETLGPWTQPSSLVLPAPPWSVVTPLPPRTYGPSVALQPSTPWLQRVAPSRWVRLCPSSHQLRLSP